MPLNTQIIRNGKTLKLPWSDFHVAAMLFAVSWEPEAEGGVFKTQNNYEPKMETHTGESGKEITAHFIVPGDAFMVCSYGFIGMTVFNKQSSYELQKPYRFCDCTDGEILELHVGDVLKMWRD